MIKHRVPRSRPLGHSPAGEPYRVVVVDDEFPHRRVMVQILASAGFAVVAEGTNGEEAVRLTREHDPDFLFLDFHMPRMDGLTALNNLRESHPALKAVMFTTETGRRRVVELLASGIRDFIVKPLDRKVVLAKLEKLVKL